MQTVSLYMGAASIVEVRNPNRDTSTIRWVAQDLKIHMPLIFLLLDQFFGTCSCNNNFGG